MLNVGISAERPLVSAVVIFLNGEAFIAEAIESIVAQSLEDWELLLVDDGSTTAATSIAKKYAEAFPGKIKYLEHPGHENRGMSASRNLGLKHARGSYIAFLDADDVWLPRRLEVHCDILERRPDVSMVVGPTLQWVSWTDKKAAPHKPWLFGDALHRPRLPVDEILDPPSAAIRYLQTRGAAVPGICSITARREDVLAAGGFDDSFRTLFEDQVFFVRMALRYRILAIDVVLDKYRQHPDSACAQEGGAIGDAKFRPVFMEWLQGEMVDGGFKDPDLWLAYRRAMIRFDRPRLWWWATLPRRMKQTYLIHKRRLLARFQQPHEPLALEPRRGEPRSGEGLESVPSARPGPGR